MNNLSVQRTGEASIFLATAIRAFFPVLTILSYNDLSPLTSLAWMTLISLFFFIAVAAYRHSWVNVWRKDLLWPLLGVTAINGILFYVLVFIGLQYTSAGNASIIATFEIFFTFLFFNVWRKEFIGRKSIFGAVLMVVSAVVILSPNFTNFQVGDFFILSAMVLNPFGNFLQQKLRREIASEQILLFRTALATPALFLLAFLFGETFTVPHAQTLWIVLISGIALFGLSKILWIESIHRISVTKAMALAGVSPALTLFYAFMLLGDVPTFAQLVALPLAIAGIYLLTQKKT